MSSSDDQTFSIQPHPATTNDPSTDPALNSSGDYSAAQAAHDAKPGVQVLDSQTASSLKEPLSKEELDKRSAELNA